jgi:hypothetical protein
MSASGHGLHAMTVEVETAMTFIRVLNMKQALGKSTKVNPV